MERIFVFEAVNGKNIYGYTREENGENLPKSLNGRSINWKAFRTLEVENIEQPRIGLNTKEMIDSINNQGFYINQISINTEISF